MLQYAHYGATIEVLTPSTSYCSNDQATAKAGAFFPPIQSADLHDVARLDREISVRSKNQEMQS